MDQHLFAEFREIKMVTRALQRAFLTKTAEQILEGIPSEFSLGEGHVRFFYNKGKYLTRRYEEIKYELFRRQHGFNSQSILDPTGIYHDRRFYLDYTPTPEALIIIRERISSRIAEKPEWYRKSAHSA